jgi:predicted NACHT family NTPase
MILGKPGAGKTTFLKHLAVQCISGIFQDHCVPVFITLKEFAETEGQPKLTEYIHQTVTTCLGGVQNNVLLQEIFDAGRALILLDGLDEVREMDTSRILFQIKEFSEKHHGNQYVMTCRIAAREYTFEQFTEVEVADFDKEQIADFSKKWFCAKKDAVKVKTFLQTLKVNPSIEELATRPLLLTLLCLAFEDSGDFPSNRSELYAAGVDILLKKWDVKRNIERDQVYKKLSLKRKEDMLSQIAWNTFASGNYFFKQKDLEQQIRDFIENVTGASTNEQELELDSEAILKSIEAQHGLFVERARGIYSFSHLTFHEYFAAREVKEKYLFIELASHCTEKHWREVILLTVGMVPNADKLIQHCKQAADQFIANDQEIQQFLAWASHKTQTIEASYKSSAIRSFYLWIGLSCVREFARDLTNDINLDLDLSHALTRALNSFHARKRAYDLNLDFDLDFNRAFTLSFGFARDFVRDSPPDFTLALDLTCALDRSLELALDFDSDLDRSIDRALSINLDLELTSSLACARDQAFNLSEDFQEQLQNLQIELPNFNQMDQKSILKWWGENGKNWTEKLRMIMIQYRNIGHSWNFNPDQLEKIKKYLIANQILADCLNSDCVITRSVRVEIEDTLLLPIVEIENLRSAKKK